MGLVKTIKGKFKKPEQHPMDRLAEELTQEMPEENSNFFGYKVSEKQLRENNKRTELATRKSQTIQAIKGGGLAGRQALQSMIFNSKPVVDIDLTGDDFKEAKERIGNTQIAITNKETGIMNDFVPDTPALREGVERIRDYWEHSPQMTEEELNTLPEDMIQKLEDKDKKIIRI